MRPIDADALIKDNGLEGATKYGNRSAKQRTKSYSTMMLYEIEEMIDEAPTIDAEPVKHGRWIDNNNKTWSCSICQSWIPDEQHSYARYCLHCGAKMDGGTSNEA